MKTKLRFLFFAFLLTVISDSVFSQTVYTSHYTMDVSTTLSNNSSINLTNGGTINVRYTLRSGDTPIPELGSFFDIPVTYAKMSPVLSSAKNDWTGLASRTLGSTTYLVLLFKSGTGNAALASQTPGGVYTNLPSNNIKNSFLYRPNNNTIEAFETYLSNGTLSLVGSTSVAIGNTPMTSSPYVTLAEASIFTRNASANITGGNPNMGSGFYIKPTATDNTSGVAADVPASYGSSINYSYCAFYVTGEPNIAENSGIIGLTLSGSLTYNYNKPAALPVLYASPLKANVESSGILLSWTTATETNNKGFAVQRSNNGDTFTTVGFVDSKSPNSNHGYDYYYKDQNLNAGYCYYRLQQTDLDGKLSNSETVSLYFGGNLQTATKVYPNPAINKTTVSGVKIGKQILIINMSGIIVKNITANSETQEIELNGISSGMYILKTTSVNGQDVNTKFFVR